MYWGLKTFCFICVHTFVILNLGQAKKTTHTTTDTTTRPTRPTAPTTPTKPTKPTKPTTAATNKAPTTTTGPRLAPAVKLVISSPVITEGESTEVDFSCQVLNQNFKDVVAFHFRKNSIRLPLVFIRPTYAPNINQGDFKTRIKNVVGAIRKGSSMYLNVTLINPITTDSGDYRCDLLYITTQEVIKNVSSTSSLTVKPKPVTSTTPDPLAIERRLHLMESVLSNLIDRTVTVESSDPVDPYWVISLSETEKQEIQKLIQGKQIDVINKLTKVSPQMQAMTNRIAKLEAYVMDLAQNNSTSEAPDAGVTVPPLTEIDDVKERVDKLEKSTQDQSDVLDHLKQIESSKSTIAFSARLLKSNGFFNPTQNSALTFLIMDVNKGGAYNDKSGFFTAPVDGTYSFQLSLATKRTTVIKAELEITLEVNGNGYAYLTTDGGNITTIAPIVELQAGDVVKLVCTKTDHQTYVYGGPVTRFSGFRIN